MSRLFPGILVAILVATPSWIIGGFAASPKLLARPLSENVAMFLRGTPHFLLLFGSVTLVYGSLAWWLLRSLGLLNLPALLLASVLPVVVYIGTSLLLRGYDSGWTGVLLAFGIPALCIGAALWLFTVRIPI